MKITITVFSLLLLLSHFSVQADCKNLLDYETQKLRSSETVNFCENYDGNVLLVVNTASHCGFTRQFSELELLYQKYKDQGFEIAGFPSNSFNQEAAEESKTAEVCYINYGVTFTMLSPSDVRGDNANALFKSLARLTGDSPEWNFNKYLISRDASKITRFSSRVEPLESGLEEEIIKQLAEPSSQ